MTQIFESYEEELKTYFKSIEGIVGNSTLTVKSFSELKFILNDCEKTIKLLETQQICLEQPHKSNGLKKVKEYKRNYENYRKKIYALEHTNNQLYDSEKKDLLNTRENSNQTIRNAEMGYDVNEQLKDSVKLMYENMEISDGVNDELKSQSRKLINGKQKVIGVGHQLGKSERKIKSIMLKIKRNKFILYGVLALIFIVFVIILVSYFRE